MADINKRLPANVPGEFFIDSTCISCSNCAVMAPEFFQASGGYYVVHSQPATAEENRKALQVLICCPVGAIGTVNRAAVKDVMGDFPASIGDNVYYCGFNSPKTAGAASYFVKHQAGNWLICVPKYLPQLVSKFEKLGGISYIFETHRDDVGDSEKYATRFGSKRIIHRNDLDADPGAELVVDGVDPVELAPDFLLLPQPGHTEGHSMLLYKHKFLFSGDALKPNPDQHLIDTWDPEWTWYSFTEQANSAERLKNQTFEFILPSHGRRMRIGPDEVGSLISGAVERARQVKDPESHTRGRTENLLMYAASLREWGQTAYADKMEVRAQTILAYLATCPD